VERYIFGINLAKYDAGAIVTLNQLRAEETFKNLIFLQLVEIFRAFYGNVSYSEPN